MATTTSITDNYAGEVALPYIRAAVLSPVTLDNVTKHLNVKYKTTLRTGSGSISFSEASCAWTEGSNTITLGEAVLEVNRLQLNEEFCKETFVNTWDSLSMGNSNMDEDLPASFTEFILQEYAGRVGDKLETLIWTGDVSNAGEFDGFIKNLGTADITGAALSKSNIIAQLEAVEDAIPDAVWAQNDMALYMGTAATKYYIQAQAALGYNFTYHVGRTELDFHGIPIINCPGMPAGAIVCARASDLHFGTALEADWSEVRLIDRSMIDGSQNVRLLMRFSADTAITNRTQIVYRSN